MGFITLAQTSGGFPGSACQIFNASTADSLATVEASGYVAAYYSGTNTPIMKLNDMVFVTYGVSGTPPSQTSVGTVLFIVTATGGGSLVPYYTVAGSVGGAVRFDVTVGQAALASAGKVVLHAGVTGQQFVVEQLWANKGGTNFSGGSGDRLLAISDGTTVYSVIPATNIQTLVNSGWGISTPLPFPAGAGVSINTYTAVGADLYAQYSGGSADYTAGSVVLSGVLRRVV
jgi:hypothetical protein